MKKKEKYFIWRPNKIGAMTKSETINKKTIMEMNLFLCIIFSAFSVFSWNKKFGCKREGRNILLFSFDLDVHCIINYFL